MIFTFQLTPLAILATLAVLLFLVAWLTTRNEPTGGIGGGLYVLAIWGGTVFVWLLVAVLLLSIHYFTHS